MTKAEKNFLREFLYVQNFGVKKNRKSWRKELGVMAAYEELNSYYKKLIAKDIKEVSWQKFKNTKGHLKKFFHWNFMKREIPPLPLVDDIYDCK